jgi:phosphoserine phosphatase
MRVSTHPVYILDLDGTILRTNSFPYWVLFLARAPFPGMGWRRRAKISGAVVAMLVGRKLGLIDHERFKWHLQQLWQGATGGNDMVAQRFAERLIAHVRPEMGPVLTMVATGRIDAVMATAAPADYAQRLGRVLGFKHVIATRGTRPRGEPSNVGEQKRKAVLEFLARHGWHHRPRVVFTDHRDDLPLIGICRRVYWFGSEEDGRDIARAAYCESIRFGLRPLRSPSSFAAT